MFLCLVLVLCVLPTGTLAAEPTWRQAMAMTQAYLIDQAQTKAPVVSSTSGEWQVLGLTAEPMLEKLDRIKVKYGLVE